MKMFNIDSAEKPNRGCEIPKNEGASGALTAILAEWWDAIP
jgi:hypothetical protein